MNTPASDAPPVASRRYGGREQEQRVADRRAKLLDAAIKLAGQGGRESVSVTNTCAAAGLTTRYFYESFSGKDDLFAKAYEMAGSRLIEAIERRTQTNGIPDAAIAAFFTVLAAEPGESRVFLLDLDHLDPALQSAAQSIGSRLGKLFAPRAASNLARAGALGAILTIARLWIAEDFASPLMEVTDIATGFAGAA